jgi:uncharacterized membrane protein
MTPTKAPLTFLGKWKLASCKSSRPDLPHPASGITTFTEDEAAAIHYTAETVWSNGHSTKVSAVIHLDGSWRPVTGSMLSDSLSFVAQEDGSFHGKMRKSGVGSASNRSAVSADGKTSTGHWEVIGPDGTQVTWETISERR